MGAGAGFDVNTASSAELRSIPGVGPVLAQRIVEARPFATADELRRVKRIGEKTYARIRRIFIARERRRGELQVSSRQPSPGT